MPKPPQPAALQYRKTPALIATAYLVVLIVPWILTCVLSSRAIRQSDDDSGAVATPELAGHLHRLAFLIDVLNVIAALAALPVIYALLARAAVVFSQRTNRAKTLNVRQLFGLADRRFLRRYLAGNDNLARGDRARTSLNLLGCLLILLALILPPIRAILVYTEPRLFPEAFSSGKGFPSIYPHAWSSARVVGLDPPVHRIREIPGRLAVEKTRHALINTFPTEWQTTAWYDPDTSDAGLGHGSLVPGRYFASAVPRDTATGMYKQHALRMNSSSWCNDIAPSEFPASCPGAPLHTLDLSYDNANLTVQVCVPGVTSRDSPWNDTENRQDLTEVMYINVPSPDPRAAKYRGLSMRCIGQTSMGYFELGNSFNGRRFGSLLPTFKFPAKNAGEFTDEVTDAPRFEERHGRPEPKDYMYRAAYSLNTAPGPLAITAHALFGQESFFDLAQSITQPNDTLSQALCRLSPIPFQRMSDDLRRCEPEDPETSRGTDSQGRFASYYGWANDRVYGLVKDLQRSNDSLDSLLNTGMYLASKATLELAVVTYGSTRPRDLGKPNQILYAEGVELRTPVLSTVALAVVSVLWGLQVIGILALLWYIYSVPTWTGTLDALAMARVVGLLAARDGRLLRSDGLWKLTEEQLRELESMDGLVGTVEDKALSSGDSKEVAATVDPAVPDSILSVGALGVISRRSRNHRESSV
ncbi:hypothetical protein C8A00DRAFT_11766 [Chaetomidium leptoderma]|uniref:Uncharacterized protein n=1 Tax=Chaetomidium leptoderma TaxID=669021 RepID=A0AAN6VTD1_9PEZI|nr:hypothetical protein C8A00DRAFT_11766 [Chaetomidium leptoderma]